MTPRNTILFGDALDRLRQLPEASVDCVMSSPPYFQLRDYGVDGQLGLEPAVTEWVESLRRICRELARVLKPSGALWLNLGDSYSRHARFGTSAKGLFLAPERLIIALAADGWIVRNKVVWSKPNPMPHGVGDRLSLAWEPVYLLVRSHHYFFDLDAVREPFTTPAKGKPAMKASDPNARPSGAGAVATDTSGRLVGKNPGDVWTIPIGGYRGAHFATFPPELVRRPLLSTCPEAICVLCGKPWRRGVTMSRTGETGQAGRASRDTHVLTYPRRWRTVREIGELVACGCGAPTRPGLVLDPFFGTGTVGLVASTHRRDWLGIELNPDYLELARLRLGLDPSQVRY